MVAAHIADCKYHNNYGYTKVEFMSIKQRQNAKETKRSDTFV